MEKRLFTIEEACEYLGFKRATLYEWAERGKIPFVKCGNGKGSRIRFDKADLDAKIEEWKVCHEQERA